MAPAQIQNIIREAQENHAADGKERTYQGHKFMVGEGFTVLLHKAVQERERDEAEEDDKENSTADHSLGFWDLLPVGFVEILAAETRGDEVATEGRMRVSVATNPSSEPIKFTNSGIGNSGKAHMVTGQAALSAASLANGP